MKPEDIHLIRTPASPVVAPDEERVAFVVSEVDAGSYRSSIHVVAVEGGQPPVRLTEGPRDIAPAWSPDGRWLAFLRAEAGLPHQLMVMPAHGGPARRLTEHRLGVGSPVTARHARAMAAPVWSPDSTRIAYVARVATEGRSGETLRRITQLRYRVDELGYVHDRRSQVFVVGIDDAKPRMLTDGRWDHWDISWHPDGTCLLAASARHEDHDLDEANDIVLVGLDGREKVLTDQSTTVNLPTFAPDGERIFFMGIGPLGADRNDARGRNLGLWSVPVAGGSPHRLTDAESVDLDDGRTRPLRIDTQGVLGGRLERGAVLLSRIGLDGKSCDLIAGRRQVLDYDQQGRTIAAVVADEASAGEVVALRDDHELVLTRLGQDLAGKGLRPMHEITALAPDGYPVHGWLTLPEGEGPHPLLVYIHGGPDLQFGYSLSDEIQVYADAGLAVLVANPRGSAGYGERHARIVRGNFGTLDADDIVALHEAACARTDIDRSRSGVMGGSYGGFMTAWLAAHHGKRFRAALCERGVYAWTSMMGTADISVATKSMIGDKLENWPVQSPISHVDQIDIPLMIMHWEDDRRVPFEQAQQLFAALRSRKKPVEFVVFPGGSHNSFRHGPPAERMERFETILDWFNRHLGA